MSLKKISIKMNQPIAIFVLNELSTWHTTSNYNNSIQQMIEKYFNDFMHDFRKLLTTNLATYFTILKHWWLSERKM